MEKNLRKKVQKASQDDKTSRGLYEFKGFRHHSQFDIRVVQYAEHLKFTKSFNEQRPFQPFFQCLGFAAADNKIRKKNVPERKYVANFLLAPYLFTRRGVEEK